MAAHPCLLQRDGWATCCCQSTSEVYYVTGDTLRIAAFWDMRMNPDKLKKTI
jgi:hypothetical protein